MAEIPSYQEVLEMLAEKAAAGSVSAMITLERVLREEKKEDDEVGAAIDRILSKT